mmetsp:Transcript_16568/g.28196  ORF Transcript_16568/g.28196 Transcript_16568/m.28196 type:complete len:89 (+) Transcript_16568:199-465(+)
MREQLLRFDGAIFCLQLLSFSLSMAQYRNYSGSEEFDSVPSYYLRSFVLLFQLLTCYCLGKRYFFQLQIIIFKDNRVDEHLTLSDVGL